MSLCKACKGTIHHEAKICPHCRAWQNPGEYFRNLFVLWILFMVICGVFAIIGTDFLFWFYTPSF